MTESHDSELGFDLIDGDEMDSYSITEKGRQFILSLCPAGSTPTTRQMIYIYLLWAGVQEGEGTERWLNEIAIPFVLAGMPVPRLAGSREVH